MERYAACQPARFGADQSIGDADHGRRDVTDLLSIVTR
jgi:hypothetical protein